MIVASLAAASPLGSSMILAAIRIIDNPRDAERDQCCCLTDSSGRSSMSHGPAMAIFRVSIAQRYISAVLAAVYVTETGP